MLIGKIVSLVVGASAGAGIDMLISGAGRMVADANKVGKIGRVVMGIGAGVCGAMVADKAQEYIDEKINRIELRARGYSSEEDAGDEREETAE